MASSEKESLLASSPAAVDGQDFGSISNNRPAGGDEDGDGDDFDDLGRVYTDQLHHMTWARRVSRNLSRYRWYHPRGHEPSTTTSSFRPKLDSAWSYFEHFVLPRHFAHSEAGEGDTVNLIKAEPGEISAETRLYNVWSTPEKDLADMGLGIGIYFFTLRCLALVMLLAGLINAPNLMYYNSDEYNDDEAGGVPYVLRRSAICTDYYWAACPSCTIQQWNYFPQTFKRYAESTDGLRFIKVNTCNFGYFLGLFTLISVIFVSVALYFVCFCLIKRKELEYDLAQQTAADYSVAVENPPKDADDAEKWKEFFSQFGHVTCLTIAIDNEELVRALVERRRLMYQLHQLLPPGVKFDKFNLESMAEQAEPLVWWQKLMGTSNGTTILAEINKLDEKILKLSEGKYDVSEIFVTFETEEAQRSALRALCVPRIKTLKNSISGLPRELLYDGEYVLNVMEAPEPTAVRWQDLDDSLKKRIAIRLVTSSVTLILIICGMLIITHYRRKYGPAMAALAISVLNTIAPYMCYYLTEYESHRTEGGKQASRYFKITAAMWVFTALVTALITPFTDTVSNSSDSILYSLYAIFIFELIRGPITQCFDISGNIKRHFLGPRVTNGLKLTGLFQGTEYELSERYTNLSNVLFLTFYYATIFPAGYYFCALILTVHYWVDKYCLLRIWTPAPQIGTRVSEICRGFIMATVVVLAVLSAYYVSGFPFDNACESSKVPTEYVGEFTAVDGDGKEVSVTIDENANSFFYCNMDMQRYKPWPAFPAWASNQPAGSEWMDEDQENISWVFGWTSIVAILLVGLILLRRIVIKFIIIMFFGHYIPGGEPSKVGFSDVKEIFAYVCQVRVPGMPAPILACDVNAIDRELIGWDDPINGVNAHNVLCDIPAISEKPIFSVIKHWPPPGKT